MLGLGVSVISAPMDRQADVVERHTEGCFRLVDGDVDPMDGGLCQADVRERCASVSIRFTGSEATASCRRSARSP